MERRSSSSEGRQPPHSPEAEAALLGAVLLRPGFRDLVADQLEPSDFHIPAHAHVFDAVVRLGHRGDPADTTSVADEMRAAGTLERAGGVGLLSTLLTRCPALGPASVERWVRTVSESAVLRRLIVVADGITESAYAGGDASEVLDAAEASVCGLSRPAHARSATMGQLIESERIRYETARSGEAPSGLPTGITSLDALLGGGLKAERLYVVAARPSMGKSALGHRIALSATWQGESALVASLEMSGAEVVERMLAADAMVPHETLMKGELEPHELARYDEAADRLGQAAVEVLDAADLGVAAIRGAARRLEASHGGLGVVVVDYLQLIATSGAENRQLAVAEITRSLKVLARMLEVPVVALAQLSRAVEQRADKRPVLSDLRECLAGDALVLNPDTGRSRPIAELYDEGRPVRVLALGEDLKLHPATAEIVVESGVKPLFRLRTRSGREIRASANHPLLTLDGWRRLDELDVGKKIAVPQVYPGCDVLWDRVEAVEPDGEEMTYDLVVPGAHNFVANDIVVHNSGEVENSADVITFIYRDDYYDHSSPSPGVAELIVAKNRHGKVGTAKARWIGESMAFEDFDVPPPEPPPHEF